MTQEEKELLLKYLCMALPYGVMVNVEGYDTEKLIGIENETITTKATPTSYSDKGEYPIDIVKPYLRPMSSMTEEEEEEFVSFTDTMFRYGEYNNLCVLPLDAIYWLLKHHFDFMDLIPKGLTIEVIESNNPYKN